MATGDDQLPAELPADPPKYADIELTSEQIEEARKRYPDASEAKAIHFMKLSVLANFKKHYTTPDGRRLFGGAQPNAGRKATKRIGEAIVEAAQGRHKEVVDAAFSALDSKEDASLRHKAAMNIARHEREERVLDMQEDEFARKTEDEVRSDAAKLLTALVQDGKISLDDIIKGQKVDAETDGEEITEADEIEAA